MKWYQPKYLKLYEVLSPQVYFELADKGWINKDGHGFAWILFDEGLLRDFDVLRKIVDNPATVNNWYWHYKYLIHSEQKKTRKDSWWEDRQKEYPGLRIYSGYRPEWCEVGTKWGEHYRYKALDIIFRTMSADQVREIIFENQESFQYITVIETGISWLHIAVRNYLRNDGHFWLVSRK